MRPVRVDYDAIAHLFDRGPHRTKTVDPELLAFIDQRMPGNVASILDVGCGTGNQLIVDRPILPSAQLVGLDRSLGMLRQARPKAPDIAWVQADASALPFKAESFDFITCQFALHHIQDKVGMLRETLRVLRIGGRLILRNLCPQDCADWLYYDYFPEARTIDLEDFWLPEIILAEMNATGFVAVAAEREHLHFEQDLRSWLDTVHRRDTCSQLLAISDVAYRAGLSRLMRELADRSSLQISEFSAGDFGSNRQAISVETDRPFRSKAAPCSEGVSVPASANRRCGVDPSLPWSLKASTLVVIVHFGCCGGPLWIV